MRIGFIGLGVMGAPMACHLVAAGHDVIGFNRSAPGADALARAGGRVASSPAEVARASEALVLMLPDSPDVEAVLFGEGGAAAALAAGTLVVDCSTIAPDAARSHALRLAEDGIGHVDAPVSGGEAGAVAGTLAVMLGGSDDAVAAARPVIEPFTGSAAHVGPSGSGQLVKAANQVIVAGNITVLAEALSMLRRTDVDLDAALRVLGGGLAASRVLDLKAPAMLGGDFAPGFRLALHHKDLRIALGAAEDAGVGLPVTGAVTQLVQAMRAAGDGDLDHSALIRGIERLNGRLSPTHDPEGN